MPAVDRLANSGGLEYDVTKVSVGKGFKKSGGSFIEEKWVDFEWLCKIMQRGGSPGAGDVR